MSLASLLFAFGPAIAARLQPEKPEKPDPRVAELDAQVESLRLCLAAVRAQRDALRRGEELEALRRQVQRLEAERGDCLQMGRALQMQMAQCQQSAAAQQAQALHGLQQQAAYGLQSQGLAQYQQVIHDAAVSGVGLLRLTGQA